LPKSLIMTVTKSMCDADACGVACRISERSATRRKSQSAENSIESSSSPSPTENDKRGSSRTAFGSVSPSTADVRVMRTFPRRDEPAS
jgi:hypothetical protein